MALNILREAAGLEPLPDDTDDRPVPDPRATNESRPRRSEGGYSRASPLAVPSLRPIGIWMTAPPAPPRYS